MATEAASAGDGAAYEEERRKRILENLKHLEDLGITKMAKSLIQATRQQDKSTRASPKSRKKFEVTTEVRRSSRPRNQVSYKDDFLDDDDDDEFVRRRRFSRGPENGRGCTGRISSDKQQQSAFNRAEKFQDSLDPGSLSFVKPMVRSHVSGCFWLVSCCSLGLVFFKLLISVCCLTNIYTYVLSTKKALSIFCYTRVSLLGFVKIICLPLSKMVLEDEEGGEFDVVYIGNRTGLGGGWRGFSMHHDLEDGDSLVVELAEPDRFKIYIFKATEDTNEAKPGDKTAGVDIMDSDSAQEEPDQTDSPVSETPSSPEPLKGAKRRKLHGQQQFSC